MDKPPIAFLGTGMLGGGMAEAALRRGESVAVYNRSRDKTAPLAALGARVADSPADAVRGAARVHVVLSDDASVDAVLGQARAGLAPDAVVVDHTTTSPAGTAERAARLAREGVRFLHAPVFMSPANARAAQGLIMAAGPRAVFDAVEPALASMASRVWYVGERVDLAACHKLSGNAMIIAIATALADVFAMGGARGLSPEQVMGVFEHFDPSGVLKYRGPRMAQRDFSPSFALTMARKDVRLMIEAAAGAPLAVLPGVAARMDEAIAAGRGEQDVGVVADDAFIRRPT